MRRSHRSAVLTNHFTRRYATAALAIAACAGLGATSAMGASGTWDGSSDSNWGTAANWSTSVNPPPAPGATSGTTNTESASFIGGTAPLNVTLDSYRNLNALLFGNNGANLMGAYVIGSTSGNALYLTSHTPNDGFGISVNSNHATIKVNAPITWGNYNTVTISAAGGHLELNGAQTLITGAPNNAAIVVRNSSGTITINGAIAGSGGIYLNGGSSAAELILNSANTFIGGILNDGQAGMVYLNATGNVAAGNVNAFRGGHFTIGATNAITGTASLIVGNLASANASSAVINSDNDYSGTTSVGQTNSTLLVNNTVGHTAGASGTGSGNVSVGKGLLGGNGYIVNTGIGKGVSIAAEGRLSPGAAAATVGTLTMSLGNNGLNISGAVAGTNSQALLFDLNTPAASDLVTLAGKLTLGSGKLEFDDFNFNLLGGFGAGTYTLFQTNTVITDTLGSNLSGTLDGKLSTLSFDGTGKNIILTVVPEPATLGLLAVGGLGLLGRRRRMA